MGSETMRGINLFALGGSRDFGERIAGHLGVGLDEHEDRTFEDGEHKARPLVSVVVPYLAYARKDRKTQARDPVTTRYVAALFEAVGVDRVLSIDVHNLAAFQNAFRCPTDHLEARPLFARHFADVLGDEPIIVLSPDVGGMKRADAFRQT